MYYNAGMTKPKPKRKELRDATVVFRCPSALREAIERAAAADQRSLSDWIVIKLTEATTKRGGR